MKFAGDKFQRQREKIKPKYGDDKALLDDVFSYLSDNVFYLPEEIRWNYIVDHASDNDIAVKLDTAMADIETKNTVLSGAVPQRFYSTFAISKETLKELIDNINRINEKQFHDKDLIGRVY